MEGIHPTAIVEDGAQLAQGVTVGPYSIIERGAVVGEHCVIESHVRIYRHTRMGRHNRICHGATLGSEPQDLGFTPGQARPLTIGDHNRFRENVNISHGVKTDHGTTIGDHNYFMAFSHAGHDCVVGDHNILANAATLAGHVMLEDHIFIAGLVAVHQFCRIGAYCMISGVLGVGRDVPPYVLAGGERRAQFSGLNLVGLKRAGFGPDQRTAIKRAYRILYRSGLSRSEALERLEQEDTDEIRHILRFVRASERGLVSPA